MPKINHKYKVLEFARNDGGTTEVSYGHFIFIVAMTALGIAMVTRYLGAEPLIEWEVWEIFLLLVAAYFMGQSIAPSYGNRVAAPDSNKKE